MSGTGRLVWTSLVREAVISGRVVTGDTPALPVRRAVVMVNSVPDGVSRTVLADDDGDFRVSGLTAGKFLIAAAKGGYLTTPFGATGPSRRGTPIVLTDDELRPDVVIALPRGGVITGTVTNTSGEPASDVSVSLLQRRMTAAGRVLVPAVAESAIRSSAWPSTAATDDRGVYRLYGLPPGEYIVAAKPVGDALTHPMHLTTQGDVSKAATLILEEGSRQPAEAPADLITAIPAYYPGTQFQSDAVPLLLGVGEEKSGVDIRLAYGRPTTVEISVAGLADGGSAPVFFHVLPRDPVAGSEAPPSLPVRDGRVRATGLAPGRYLAEAVERADASVGQPFATAQADIETDGHDLIEISLVLRPCPALSGRIVFEGADPPATMPEVSVTLAPADSMPNSWMLGATTIARDGSFSIPAISPGRYWVSASRAEGPPGIAWHFAGAIAAGVDAADEPLDVRPDGVDGPIVVTMTTLSSTLRGTLLGTGGDPEAGYSIVVFSEQPSEWHWNSRRIRTVRSATDGTFSVPDLPPGRYRVAVLPDVGDDEVFDPDFLTGLVPLSVSVVLHPGTQLNETLRVRSGGELALGDVVYPRPTKVSGGS